LPILEDADQEYELARCRLTAARLYLATGHPGAAQALWTAAVATFRKLEARLDLQAAAGLFPDAMAAPPSLLPQETH
jgi:hypothetical protein